MKIALVHDYLKEYGGAERVLEALHELYPDAPVYTSLYFPSYLGPHQERFKNWTIHTSWLQHIPFAEKLISPLRLLAPWAFKSFDFSQFDVVIVSATGAYESNMITKGGAVQVCYCHTPPRYLYGYATAREWKKNILLRIVGEAANHILRLIDFTSAQKVDYFIANSINVQKRIEKFYRKSSVVVYPPVEIADAVRIRSGPAVRNDKKREYYLAGGRLARPKNIDLIVKTCTEMNIPLKVFGKDFAGYGEELRQLAGARVEFVGEVTDAEKYELMKGAKAYIFASVDEDFGITPVEAMSCGTPVIAYKSGGVVESVLEDKTGLFFDELTKKSLSEAVKRFEKKKISRQNCQNQAEKFSKENFKKQIQEFTHGIKK